MIYQAGLVRWLGCCSATVEVPGSIPTDASKLNFLLVNTKWGQAIKTVKLRVVAVTHGDDYQLFSPPTPPKFVWEGLFHHMIYQAGLVRWLGCCSATVKVPGSIPTDASKLNFFLVNTKWGQAIKTVKLRVVAVTHGDDYQLFSCRQKERDKKK